MRLLWTLATTVFLAITFSDLTKGQTAESFCLFPLPPPYWASFMNTLFKVYARGKSMSFHIPNVKDCKRRAEQLEKKGFFAPGRRVVIITHGYFNNQLFTWLYEQKDGILKHEDVTVLVVVWQQGAATVSYPSAAANTKTVAQVVSKMIDAIRGTKTFAAANGNGTNQPYVHCIGHSLGAHVCGQAGRLTKVHRISGIDPAGPGFEQCWDWGLNKDCADCVDNIHADGSQEGHFNHYFPHLGSLFDWGTVDFYPNGGKNQPRCTPTSNDATCSHMQSIDQYTYSIKNKGVCSSRGPCEDANALPASCGNVIQSMGYWSSCHHSNPKPKPGKFYLKTTASGRFC